MPSKQFPMVDDGIFTARSFSDGVFRILVLGLVVGLVEVGLVGSRVFLVALTTIS